MTAIIGATVILVLIPHPKIDFLPLLYLSSTYAADSAFEVALLVFWPKSSKVNCKSKLKINQQFFATLEKL